MNLVNPNVLTDSITVSGTVTPPVSGQSYSFTPLSGADAYELEISKSVSSSWVEGAEDSPTPEIEENISSSYSLRQTSLVRTGSKAFQLALPSFDDQNFVIVKNITPTAGSNIEFYERARFTTTTTTLEMQVSNNGGASWVTKWSRNGVGGSSLNWDSNWIFHSISASEYAGQLIQLRFLMKHNNASISPGVDSNYGFFIDDVSVTDSSYLSGANTTSLFGSSSSFMLDSSAAGEPLVEGDSFVMRIRPKLGCKWFGFGERKLVTISAPTGYDLWVADNYPGLTGGFSGDHDADGIPNGAEYAFGLNPVTANSLTDIPQATLSGGYLQFSYTPPAGVVGVTYGALWSNNMSEWYPITNSGSANRLFRIGASGETKLFIRHSITQSP